MGKLQIKAKIEIEAFTALDMSLVGFTALLNQLAQKIGADEKTANVTIEYESEPYDYGGHIEAYVWRYETDEEEAVREAAEAKIEVERQILDATVREVNERRIYEALRKKFGE